MASYRYKAMTAGGMIVRGAFDAPTEAAVIQHIRELGHYPLTTSPAGSNDIVGLLNLLRLTAKPSRNAVLVATQELATLLQAGLELDRALGILVGLKDLGPLREPFVAVRARVRDGASLGDALAEQPVFPKFYVGMVRAGEMGGTLDVTLRRLCDYLAKSIAVRDAIASALVYPLILLVTSGLSIIFILTFVLPEFEPLFAEAGKALPLPARIVMGAGHFVQDFWWAMALVIAGAVFWLRRELRKPEVRRHIDGWLLKVPVLGTLLVAMDVERFSRTLGTLLVNGVPLPTALSLGKDALTNSVLAGAVRDTVQSLREGEGVADRLSRAHVFPDMTIDLIRVGEKSGKLDEMLLRQADLDSERIRHQIDRLLALLVPALTVFLGLIVGALIAAMLTAILSVNDLAVQ
jgi:general secretion pathway protein F